VNKKNRSLQNRTTIRTAAEHDRSDEDARLAGDHHDLVKARCLMALIDQINRSESGGDPNARDAHWPASGSSPFIGRAWLDMPLATTVF
jgi:hypothetical protein